MNIPTSSFFLNVFLLFFTAIFFTKYPHCKAAKSVCNGDHYSKGSKVESNINIVVNYLVQHISSSRGFNTSFHGESPDDIYGLLQCRGDTTAEECQSCSIEANNTLRQECANKLGGRVWLDKCYLRFEHNNFIGDLDTTTYLYRINHLNSTDPDAFSSAVKGLLSNLSVEVSKSSNLYSSDSATDFTSSTEIYGLVQCWRDISIDGCATCLDNAISDLLIVTNGGYSLGAVAYSGSCTVRYETYPFLKSPPNLHTPSSKQKKSSNKIPIILGFLGGFIFLILLGGLLFKARRKIKSAISGKGKLQEQEQSQNTEQKRYQNMQIQLLIPLC